MFRAETKTLVGLGAGNTHITLHFLYHFLEAGCQGDQVPGISGHAKKKYIKPGSMEGRYGCHLMIQVMRYYMYQDTSAAA